MKKLFFILLILISLITIGLFPLDLFIFEVPEWIIYVLLAAMVALTVLIFVKGKAKLPGKIISVFLSVTVTAESLAGIILDPYFNNIYLRVTSSAPTLPYDTVLSADKACADLDYAMKYLKKDHPALTNGLTPELQSKYNAVTAELKAAGSVTVCELARSIESVFSVLGDAHSSVSANYAQPLYLKHWYRWSKDGYSIAAINGITVTELLDRCSELYSFEAKSWELKKMTNDMQSLQGLTYLGFSVPDGVTFTLENDAGDVLTETYYPDDFVTYSEYLEINGSDSTAAAKSSSFVSYTVDEDNNLAVLTLTDCKYNSEYINCLRELFTEVKNKGIGNVAVDLRSNGGGNDRTAVEFIRYLDIDEYIYASETQRLGFLFSPLSADRLTNERYTDLTFTGNVYVLSSSGTFSSAMLFTQYIKDNGLGTVIGEPPGNDPNGYGDIAGFRMPNSGITFSVSTKRFYRADKECADKYVMPDISCNADDAFDVMLNSL